MNSKPRLYQLTRLVMMVSIVIVATLLFKLLSQNSTPITRQKIVLATDKLQQVPVETANAEETSVPLSWESGVQLPTEPTLTVSLLATAFPLTPEYPPGTPGSITTETPPPVIETATPLPTPNINNTSPYAAHNLKLQPMPLPVSPLLNDKSGNAVADLVWAPDGKTFLYTVPIGEIKVNRWINSKIVLFDEFGDELRDVVDGYSPVWSPSGTLIAYEKCDDTTQKGSLAIVDLVAHEITPITDFTNDDQYWGIKTWISDSELLYHYRGELVVFTLTSKQQSKFLDKNLIEELTNTSIEPPFHRVSSNPHYGLIAVDAYPILMILQRHQDRLTLLRKLDGIDAGVAAFSPDGTAVAYVSNKTRQVTIVSLIDENAASVAIPNDLVGVPMAWSPDSQSLLYKERGGIFVVNRDGSGLQLLNEVPTTAFRIAWTIPGPISFLYNTGQFVSFMPSK